ncbi:hypothetical protein NX801_00275 [Streptomyces sp. LP05-1]|uniref:Uncharacterized protein n=1 Tax=Streptomyces pyxinae TaxID=2970734 RepID=A0ABT2C9S4_9ACTN|nr:hypothetical protein [Streptomyces sp. LP05-1]MCS0634124.1 hypothetical protein [Streptomyces sp. LP05-1]
MSAPEPSYYRCEVLVEELIAEGITVPYAYASPTSLLGPRLVLRWLCSAAWRTAETLDRNPLGRVPETSGERAVVACAGQLRAWCEDTTGHSDAHQRVKAGQVWSTVFSDPYHRVTLSARPSRPIAGAKRGVEPIPRPPAGHRRCGRRTGLWAVARTALICLAALASYAVLGWLPAVVLTR